jgi:hypothetical protein
MRARCAKIGAWVCGTVLLAIAAVSLFVYRISRQEVVTAYQLIDDASRLTIGSSGLNEVLLMSQKYRGEATGSSHEEPCQERDCLVYIAVDTHDFWDRHPKLNYLLIRILRRGWRFRTLIWVKNGKVDAIQQWFNFSNTKSNLAVIATVSRPSSRLCNNESYRLHPTFALNPGPKHFNVWVSSQATQERELLRLNVSCVLSTLGCRNIGEMAPQAWRRYIGEQPEIKSRKKSSDLSPECY